MRISRTYPQTAPEKPRKHNLTFSGNLGVHGKTILPLTV